MPHSFGYRARTRDMYSKKKSSMPKPNTRLVVYRLGDYVDVLCDPALHQGMPYKFYFGKTGRIWNVTKRSVGIELLKTVGNRKRTKKISVRIEHIRHSKCRDGLKVRIAANEAHKASVRNKKDPSAGGVATLKSLKRQPEGPKGGYVLKKRACNNIKPMW